MAIIRPMTQAEQRTLLEWAAVEGWNPGLHDADCFWRLAPDGFLALDLAARGERQLLEFESAMDRQLRRVWVSVVSNELFAVETAEMLERRTNSASRRDRGPRTLAGFRHRAVFSSSG